MAVCSQPSKMGFLFCFLGKAPFSDGMWKNELEKKYKPCFRGESTSAVKGTETQTRWLAPVCINYRLDLCIYRPAFTSVSEVYIIPSHLMQSPHYKGIKVWLYIVRSLCGGPYSAFIHGICSNGLIALSEMLMNSTEATELVQVSWGHGLWLGINWL